MTRPRMHDDRDPCLAQVRILAAGFPESSEVESWGRPTFRAGRRIFAAFGTQASPHGLVLRPDEDERAALEDSYRQVALRRMVRELDARAPHPRNESPHPEPSTQRLPPTAQRDLSIPPLNGS